MPESHDWSAWLSTLGEVRPTPPDVRDRIRRRVVDRAEAPDAGTPVARPGRTIAESRWKRPTGHLNRGWKLPAAVLSAAAAVLLYGFLWGGWLDQRPNSDDPEVVAPIFPPPSSEVACRDLRVASDDLALLAEDGPLPLAGVQLDEIEAALGVFVDEIAAGGLTESSELEVWRAVVTELRQAGVFAHGGDTGASNSLVEGARRQILIQVWSSRDPIVVACFAPWLAGTAPDL